MGTFSGYHRVISIAGGNGTTPSDRLCFFDVACGYRDEISERTRVITDFMASYFSGRASYEIHDFAHSDDAMAALLETRTVANIFLIVSKRLQASDGKQVLGVDFLRGLEEAGRLPRQTVIVSLYGAPLTGAQGDMPPRGVEHFKAGGDPKVWKKEANRILSRGVCAIRATLRQRRKAPYLLDFYVPQN